jgi:hypothetical protein
VEDGMDGVLVAFVDGEVEGMDVLFIKDAAFDGKRVPLVVIKDDGRADGPDV